MKYVSEYVINMVQTRYIYRQFCSLKHICHFPVTSHQANGILNNEKFFLFDSFYHFQRRYKNMYPMGYNKKETFLIAGLGNHDLPGTRHSVGMQLVKKLAGFLDITLEKKRDCLGFVGEKELSHINVVLLKPKQAMNINGTSVHKTAKKYNIPAENVYVVHDDLDKKVGKVGLKEKGSAGGHNGVRSVLQCFKTDAITRVKIGIDRPASVHMVTEYVLQKFSPSEKDDIEDAINQGIFKIAQHISTRTRLKATQVFRRIENSEDSDSGDSSRSLNDKNDGSDVT